MRHLLSMSPLFLCYKQSVSLLLYLLVPSAVQDTKGVFEPGWRQRTTRLRVVLPGKLLGQWHRSFRFHCFS